MTARFIRLGDDRWIAFGCVIKAIIVTGGEFVEITLSNGDREMMTLPDWERAIKGD